MPATETNTAPERPPRTDEEEAALDAGMSRLGALLDEGQARDPAELSSALLDGPTKADLQAALAALDPERMLPVLQRLAAPGLPNRRGVLEGVLGGPPGGAGHVLRSGLQALHRRTLLDRIFHPDRVRALRQACRPPAQEAT